jgi:hypothetical protein
MATAPNHLKALAKQSILPPSEFSVINNSPTSISAETEVDLKFFKLDGIEVLTGYVNSWVPPDQKTERNFKGSAQLLNSTWEPLTREIYNEAIGETLLCKLEPYQNPLFGVVRDLTGEFPTVDGFFLLKPKLKQAAPPGDVLPPQETFIRAKPIEEFFDKTEHEMVKMFDVVDGAISNAVLKKEKPEKKKAKLDVQPWEWWLEMYQKGQLRDIEWEEVKVEKRERERRKKRGRYVL